MGSRFMDTIYFDFTKIWVSSVKPIALRKYDEQLRNAAVFYKIEMIKYKNNIYILYINYIHKYN